MPSAILFSGDQVRYPGSTLMSMHKDAYHHIEVHSPPLGGVREAWLWERLVETRARFVRRLGISSAALREQGLRLHVDSRPVVVDWTRDDVPLGITMQLTAVDRSLTFSESVYSIDEIWQPRWRGRSRVWVERDGEAADLPTKLEREARSWLRLVRGTIPIAGDEDAMQGTARR